MRRVNKSIIKNSYLINKSGSNKIVKKPNKFTKLIKSELKRNNIFNQLMLIIYKLENNQYTQ